jgi:hypothetical protein
MVDEVGVGCRKGSEGEQEERTIGHDEASRNGEFGGDGVPQKSPQWRGETAVFLLG